jgi:hypothetical protein
VADYLLGRRFEFADQSAPDITITGFDPQQQRVRVHTLDGGKQWWWNQTRWDLYGLDNRLAVDCVGWYCYGVYSLLFPTWTYTVVASARIFGGAGASYRKVLEVNRCPR